jgi:polyphosphate kinase 2 (PPK2 family)
MKKHDAKGKAAARPNAPGKNFAKDEPKTGAKSGSAAAAAETKLSNKDYERELKKLHVELVKLQPWVQEEGLKVCVVFEGRDGAGKVGTIKAITKRVSPRVFRVIALPAPTERDHKRGSPSCSDPWQQRARTIAPGCERESVTHTTAKPLI